MILEGVCAARSRGRQPASALSLRKADIGYYKQPSGSMLPRYLPDHPVPGVSRYSLRPNGLHFSVGPICLAEERFCVMARHGEASVGLDRIGIGARNV